MNRRKKKKKILYETVYREYNKKESDKIHWHAHIVLVILRLLFIPLYVFVDLIPQKVTDKIDDIFVKIERL